MQIRFERLLWLMPAAYAVHIFEEYCFGFVGWVNSTLDGEFTGPLFLMNNGLFMAILLSLCLWASRSSSRLSAFLFFCWSSGNLFWNFVFHLGTTALFNRYSPGLVTACLLYYPISFAVAWAGWKDGRLSLAAIAAAFAAGAGVMAFVIWAGLYHFILPA